MVGIYGDLRNSVAKESYQQLVFLTSVSPFVKLEGSRSAAKQRSNCDRRFSFLGQVLLSLGLSFPNQVGERKMED